jgi:phosphatidate cytidylyltransferase
MPMQNERGAMALCKSLSCKSEFVRRLLSSLFLLPLCLFAFYEGGMLFEIFISIIGSLACYEFLKITHSRKEVLYSIPFFIFMGGIALDLGYVLQVFFLYALLSGVMFMTTHQKVARFYGAMLPFGVLCLLSIPLMHYTFSIPLLILVWATDIGAYLVGRFIGGIKLCPAISPNKTVSGAVGGLFFAILTTSGVLFYQKESFFFTDILLIAMTSLVSQGGDLWESSLKRLCGVKDSGRLIPGHGGVLDRVDGLLTASFCWWGFMVLGWI